jgi:hypothetical protein
VNKSLFSVNTVHTASAGLQIAVARDWNLSAEAFRTTLLATLNPASILLIQAQGGGVTDILNDFNQWSFFVRLIHKTHWGAALPETESIVNPVVYGAVEGFVHEGASGAGAISVQLDNSRTTTTDGSGHYRFEDVPEGRHAVSLNLAELAADLSPGQEAPVAALVKPRMAARADLRVVKAGSSIRGVVKGLSEEDRGIVRLESIVVNLSGAGRDDAYTSCDGEGNFAFYNLSAGRFTVSVDRATLPEGYVLTSDPAAEVEVGESDPVVTVRIEKRVKQLPVRKVFDSSQTR